MCVPSIEDTVRLSIFYLPQKVSHTPLLEALRNFGKPEFIEFCYFLRSPFFPFAL
jgi:hypothetical protein